MPNYPTFARFADYQPSQSTEFVRMPDGSLVMTGQRQVQTPGMFDRLKAAASSIIPAGLFQRNAEPAVPWWIAQPAATEAVTQAVAPAPVMQGGKVDPWEAIAKESAHEQGLANELSGFSKAVMASPQLIEGRWITGR